MGVLFAASGSGASAAVTNRPSDSLLHQLECRACPLNKAKHLITPKMEPSGSKKPLIYLIGEAPGAIEDEEGIQFEQSAPSGGMIRPLVKDFKHEIRWNNTIRCRPQDNRDPEKLEIECCRPSIERDIEATRPEAIFGLGAVALAWAGAVGGIELWRGRRFPVRVGKHVCWFYAMRHPSFILHEKKRSNHWKSEEEIAFQLDIKKALSEVDAGLPDPVIHTAKDARNNITCINGRSSKDLNYVIDFLEYAGECDVAGLDYETQGLRPYRKENFILTKSVSVVDETLAFGWLHKDAGWTSEQLTKLEKAWIRFLKAPAKKAVHHLSFEMEWTCFKYGLDLARGVLWEDTLTQAYVRDERVGEHKPGALSLEFITLQHYGINIKKLTKGLNKEKMANEPLEILLPYNGIDSKYHRLDYIIQAELIKKEGLHQVYLEKVRQVPTVVLTQIKGIPIDSETNKRLSIEYTRKIIEAEKRVQDTDEAKQYRRLTGQQLNPGSSQQIGILLKDVLKTREGQETEGSWSTKETVLNKIDRPIAKGIVSYRKVVKLKSTYIDPLSPGADTLYAGNVIHTSYGTCFTETGRLESSGPNVQNQPVRNEEAKKVRAQYAKKYGIVVSFDYGQIDARIIACGSRDKRYCKALWEDYDIHFEWAKRLAMHRPDFIGGKKNLNDDTILNKFRSNKVKSEWVFAIFYGASLRTTAGRFGVDDDVLRPLYDKFKEEFSDVIEWQERLIKQFEETGYVQLFEGLRRRAPLGKGQIINSPVQGATNRIVMHAMNRLSEIEDMLYQPNMQIHDDLTYFFNSINEYEDALPRILDIMLDGKYFDWFCVPLAVEIKDGPVWSDTKAVGTYYSHKRLNWPLRQPEFA